MKPRQLALPMPRGRAQRAPLVSLQRADLREPFAYSARSNDARVLIIIDRDHTQSAAGWTYVRGFIARGSSGTGIVARSRLLRTLRMQLAQIYPELPREKRRRKRSTLTTGRGKS